MQHKPLPCPQRLRRIPRQFSWIDQRLVRDGAIRRCDAGALALYLFLVTVATRLTADVPAAFPGGPLTKMAHLFTRLLT